VRSFLGVPSFLPVLGLVDAAGRTGVGPGLSAFGVVSLVDFSWASRWWCRRPFLWTRQIVAVAASASRFLILIGGAIVSSGSATVASAPTTVASASVTVVCLAS